jgi:glycosyltransferase involved in cell wall biosynthesis
MFKLTIAIPTYNGEATIRGALDSVVSQIEDGVEIVISDNASTDKTAKIIREYQLKYFNLHYFCNNENLGFDLNVDMAVRKSEGEYVWLLGDDDEIAPGGIKKVLKVLQNNNSLAAIYVNFSSFNREAGKRIVERCLPIWNDIFCDNSDQFLSTVTVWPGFLSSNIVRRSLWLQVNNRRYIGTGLLHYGTLLSILPGHSAYCIADPYVVNKSFKASTKEGNKGGVALKITLKLFDIIHELPRGPYSEKSIKKSLKVIYAVLPRKISSSRRNGLSISWPLLNSLIRDFGLHPLFWLIDIPLLFLPRFVHCLIWRTYKVIKQVLFS